MLNILVVDDEPKHRKGLTRMLKHLKPEYNIFNARDGVEALHSMNVHPIDLVFTDIQMPIMDGLEFLDHLIRRGRNENVIIMSAYSDFAYAQRALQLGASDYLLKPVDEQKIIPLLTKAEHKVSSTRAASVECILSEIFEGYPTEADYQLFQSSFPNIKRGNVLIAEFSSPMDDKPLLCLLKALLEPTLKSFGFSCAFFIPGKTLVTLIMSHEPTSIISPAFQTKLYEVIQEFSRSYNAELTIGIGQDFVEWKQEAKRAYRQACQALKAKFYKGGGGIYRSEHMKDANQPTVIQFEIGRLTKWILAGDKLEIHSYLDSAVNETMAVSLPEPDTLKYSIAASIHHLTAFFMKKGLTPLHSAAYEEALLNAHSIEQLKKSAREWIFELSDRLDQRKRCKTESIIESCRSYIDSHYHEEDLSLSRLATQFHFNPSYFCLLFKTHTHMTILQYITQTRMRAAANLLLNTSQRVYQIAENVGYKDVKYFIRLFRKEYGTSPEEYRHLSATR
ncbi:response regulator [Paenibacillus puldeungensis]|uniref:Response regulator n=1 Tax=Paenibacillus puldeungensis TaxID=696536 RepID=A0ABW3RUI0_9BACL